MMVIYMRHIMVILISMMVMKLHVILIILLATHPATPLLLDQINSHCTYIC